MSLEREKRLYSRHFRPEGYGGGKILTEHQSVILTEYLSVNDPDFYDFQYLVSEGEDEFSVEWLEKEVELCWTCGEWMTNSDLMDGVCHNENCESHDPAYDPHKEHRTY